MIQKILNEVSAIKQNNSRAIPVEINYWRSSSLGTCMRGRFFERIIANARPEYDARTMGIFALGHLVEQYVIDEIKDHPDYLVVQQGEIKVPKFNLVGHFDAIVIHIPTDKWYFLECKSKNSQVFKYDLEKNGASQHYKMQTSSYQDAIQKLGFTLPLEQSVEKIIEFNAKLPNSEFTIKLYKEADYIRRVQDYLLTKAGAKVEKKVGTNEMVMFIPPHKLESSSILYVSKDDGRKMEFLINPTDKDLSQEYLKELTILNKCWETKTPPPMYPAGAWQIKYCQYCKAGICQSLDDKAKVEELFKLAGKK